MLQLSLRKLPKFIWKANTYFLCSWLICDSPNTLLKVCVAKIKELLLKASYKNVSLYTLLYWRTQQLTFKSIYYSQDFLPQHVQIDWYYFLCLNLEKNDSFPWHCSVHFGLF